MILFCTIVLLAACQGTTGETLIARDDTFRPMSLEEAKKLTAKFEGKSLIAPPRTVSDVSALLDTKNDNHSKINPKKLNEVNAPPPNTNDKSVLARFYQNRGKAAGSIGRFGQALLDLRKAYKYSSDSNLFEAEKARLLVSLSQIESNNGNFLNAIRYLENSFEIETEWGEPPWESYWKLVNLYSKIGDLDSMQEAWEKGKNVFAKGPGKYPPHVVKHAVFEAALDAFYFDGLGRFIEAEKHIRRAIDIFRTSIGIGNRPNKYSWVLSRLAEILRKQGRFVESEITARESLTIALNKFGRNNAVTGNAARQLTKILVDQGRYDEAEKLIITVIDIFDKSRISKSSLTMGEVRSNLIQVLVLKGKWREAVDVFLKAQIDMKENTEIFNQLFLKNIFVPIALIETGNWHDALKLSQNYFQTVKGTLGANDINTALWRGVMAISYASDGNTERAIKEFQITSLIVNPTIKVTGEKKALSQSDIFIIKTITEKYIELLSEIIRKNIQSKRAQSVVNDTFQLAISLRNQTVQKALESSLSRGKLPNSELESLSRREQITKKRIEALSETLADALSSQPDQQKTEAIKILKDNINWLQSARTSLLKEIENRFPNYSNLVNPTSTSIEEIQKQLLPNQALISLYSGENKTYVWAVPKSGTVTFSAVNLGRGSLETRVSSLRKALDPGEVKTLGDIPAFDLVAAHDLYSMLLKPVETGWKGAKNLLVVANGALGQLPFSLLPTKLVILNKDSGQLFSGYRSVPWLARTHSVTVLPSVASLKSLRGTRVARQNQRPFVGFGDPFFNKRQQLAAKKKTQSIQLASRSVALRNAPQTRSVDNAEIGRLPRLPDTRTEIEKIARVMNADPSRDIFLGKRASEETVKKLDLTPYKVISFATHGLVPGDLNGLNQPALALSSPDVTGGKEDGLLTMGEIFGLRLNADWAVLSACNTAAAEGKGAEAISGLGRAFFYSGARALLVSNWPVHSGATTELMTHLFRLQASNQNMSRAEALRQTRLHMIDTGSGKVGKKSAYSYAHPIFWAPFTLVGDGGGVKSGS